MSSAVTTPSPQQAAIFAWGESGMGSAVIEAVAGAGKTWTLMGLLSRMPGSIAVCAYNKAIATEIQGKVPDELRTRVRVGTVHSFGFGALRRAMPKVRVEGKKLYLLADQLFGEKNAATGRIDPHPGTAFAVATASMAKQVGIGAIVPCSSREAWLEMVRHYDLDNDLPEEFPLEEGLRMAGRLLKASHSQTQMDAIVDFDDMVYEPVRLGLKLWRNDVVMVDEAQDTNSTRRALVKMMLRPGGRLVAVGDSRQAIYGFTGADSQALELITREFGATRLPLTVTYRCPKAVVQAARQWVSHIEAAPTAAQGEVKAIELAALLSKEGMADLTPADAVLCRNTAPLISLAYSLIRNKVACRVEGRSIGEGLAKLARRWKVKTVQALLNKVETWREKEIQKALAAGREVKAGQIADQADTLMELASAFQPTDSIKMVFDQIETMFADTPEGQRPNVLTLATIHRSKGREWKRVFWLGANRYNPSPYARQDWQKVQEDNLCYVAATRAMETLVFVAVPAAPKKGAA
jgi:DNA helicase-2/ATP-dependent DNA helicase PcrA